MFRLLFERTADAVWLFDPGNATVVDCNDAAAALMRCASRADLIGKRAEQLSTEVQPDGTPTVESVARRIAETLKTGNSRFEWTARRFDQLEPTERSDHLQSIRKNTRRMAGLMEEVLLLGSLDAGKMEPAPLDLGTFVRRLVDEVLSATNHRCPIDLLFGEMPVGIRADKRLLHHIFTNLLTNGVKYSDAGRVVRLEIGRDGADIVCAIRDKGIGIPEADREWLFNAFHRGHNVGDRPGTGLGLVIVKHCVDLHGGKILVESKSGEGTTVTVRLPM